MAQDLIHYSPLRNLLSWHTEFDDLFRDFFQGRADRAAWIPAVDIEEQDDSYLVTADVPGLTEKEIKVTLHDGVLTLHGERKAEKEDKDQKGGSRRIERTYGTFSRSFTLPRGTDPDKVKAAYKDGVLTVTVPKAEEVKPKEIEVKAG